MKTMTVTEALNELKLYDSKIDKAIREAIFIGSKKKSAQVVNHRTVDKFNTDAIASYNSIVDMIANRNKIKAAVLQSNAVTEVKVAGKTMTVAECIDHKNAIEFEISLLETMKNQYTQEKLTVDKYNFDVDKKVDSMLEALLGKESDRKIDKNSIESIEVPYRNANEYELVDPLDVLDTYKKLDENITAFQNECDTALVLSNAITTIQVDI